jgi:hypothetical protein
LAKYLHAYLHALRQPRKSAVHGLLPTVGMDVLRDEMYGQTSLSSYTFAQYGFAPPHLTELSAQRFAYEALERLGYVRSLTSDQMTAVSKMVSNPSLSARERVWNLTDMAMPVTVEVHSRPFLGLGKETVNLRSTAPSGNPVQLGQLMSVGTDWYRNYELNINDPVQIARLTTNDPLAQRVAAARWFVDRGYGNYDIASQLYDVPIE